MDDNGIYLNDLTFLICRLVISNIKGRSDYFYIIHPIKYNIITQIVKSHSNLSFLKMITKFYYKLWLLDNYNRAFCILSTVITHTSK